MKKVVSLFIVLLMPLFASAADYVEGKQYTKVSDKASAKPEVREYFSYYCGHCFRFSPFIANVEKNLPDGVKVEYNHVDFLRAASPETQQMLSRATVVAEQMGLKKEMMSAIFNYIHVQRATFSSEKDIRNVFVLNGADGEKFDKLMKSFMVANKAKKMKQNQDYFSSRGALTGVPTVIINGMYRINNNELDRNNFAQDYQNLVNYLLTKDAKKA